MITGMNHTGFVVKDLERAVEFYRDVVGLTLLDTREWHGGAVSQAVGYDSARLKGANLAAGDGHLLELLQYVHPPGSKTQSGERSAVGATHLAFTVDDIDKTYQDLVSHGAQGVGSPSEVAPGRVCCYLQDPDGNLLELVEAR